MVVLVEHNVFCFYVAMANILHLVAIINGHYNLAAPLEQLILWQTYLIGFNLVLNGAPTYLVHHHVQIRVHWIVNDLVQLNDVWM